MWIQTLVPIAANTSQTLISANPWRERLRWMVTSGGPVTVVPGLVTAVINSGMIYNGPPSVGAEGSSDDFQTDCSKDEFSVISSVASTITVWELVQNRGIPAAGNNNLGSTP